MKATEDEEACSQASADATALGHTGTLPEPVAMDVEAPMEPEREVAPETAAAARRWLLAARREPLATATEPTRPAGPATKAAPRPTTLRAMNQPTTLTAARVESM